MAKKLFHAGIVTGVMILLFVLFPDVLIPQVDDLPDAPTARAEFIRFKLPPGFSGNIFASDLPNIRALEEDPNGTIIASLTKEGTVVAVTDTDDDGEADETVTLIDGLDNPHGLSLICDSSQEATCTLYVAETDNVSAYAYDPATHATMFLKKIVSLPSAGSHHTRSLLKDPSGEKLFVSIGSSCEFCQELDKRYASVQSLDLRTGKLSTYATGLYNTVFMTMQPLTEQLWGTEMARGGPQDRIAPPDEINLIKEGNDYGWPFCYGNNLSLDDLGSESSSQGVACKRPDETPSTIDLPAHSGPLGLAFIPSEGWPADYAHDLLVVYHGSGGSNPGGGYRIVRIEMGSDGKPTGSIKPFMSGFEDASGDLLGRPVDLLAKTDGTLLISGDLFGRIYRVSWMGNH